MNNLSWMIYLADALGSLGKLLVVAGAISALVGGIAWVVSHDLSDGSEVRPRFTKLVLFGFGACALSAILPSKGTIYAIAASEYGEEVLKSETASKAVKALDAWLERQIDAPTTPGGDTK